MKKMKRTLIVLLSLALVIGMFPCMSLTAWAASHNITINNAQNGSVTASVNGSTVTSAEEGATVTLTANPDNGYRLKSISGTYKDYYNESMGIGKSTTGSSANFSYSAEECNNNGCRLYSGKKITISSSTKTITKVVFTVSGYGTQRNASHLVTSTGTMTVSGTGAGSTITISNLSTNSVSLTGNGSNNAQQWQCNRVVVYGHIDTTLNINNASDPNIRTFTMPVVASGSVSITPEFEEIPKYSVTLTGGANATPAGGSTTQTDLTGAMTTVTYTANSGYYFEEFTNITNNGITATRTNETTVTVSGTPTANASITIPDAVLSHNHSFTYSASGATITATCSGEGCDLTGNKVTLILSAGNATYSGSAYNGASLSDTTAWTAAGLTVPTIKYNGSATAPTNAGDYTASVTAGGATATKDFTIAKANPTATAPSLTATYGQTLADLTLTNPSGNTDGTWAWAVDESTSVGNVGSKTFKANFTPTDTDNYNSLSNVDVTVTVGKADNLATVTNAVSVTKGGNTVDLAQLVTLNGATGAVTYAIYGEAKGCSLEGSVLTSGDTTGDVTVTVTVAEDGNYKALSSAPITVTVTDKLTQTISAPDSINATYGDTGKSIGATLTEGNGTLSYAVKDGDAVTVDAATGALTIAKAGTAVVTVTASETKGYAKAEKDVTITVERKALTIKANDQGIYTGETVPTLSGADFYTVTGLVGSDALTTPPTLACQKDGSAAEPDNTKAGTYDIVPSGASAGDNYTISYQNGTLTVKDATFYTADGDKQKYKKSDLTFTFKMKGDDANTFKYLENFKKATIKGPGIDRALNADEYTAENGSLKLTVKNSLLKTLKAGTYTVTVYFIDEVAAHSASATFTIPSAGSGNTPGTGDDTKANNIVSAMILFLLSLSFIAYTAYNEQFRAKLLAVPAGISSFINGKDAAAVSAPVNDTVIDDSENIVFYETNLESASETEVITSEQYETDSFDEDLESEDTDDSFDENLETEDTDDSFDDNLESEDTDDSFDENLDTEDTDDSFDEDFDDSYDTDDLDWESTDSYDDLEAKLNELEAKLTKIEDDLDL